MYQFPREDEHEYKLEIKKINELIKNLNKDPLIEIKFPSESTGLDVKTCDFCKFSRSYDFGILLASPINANAFLEAGMFLSLGKRVILLNNSNKLEKLPFDLEPFFVIWYNNLEKLEKEWSRKIPKYIQKIKKYYLMN